MRSRDNEIFLTWEWLSAWWKHFGKEKELNILIIRDNDEIQAIAPLMRSTYNFLHLGKLTKIEFVGSPQSDYNAFILVKNEMKCLKLFLNYLISEYHHWNSLELREIPENTLSAKLLQKLVAERKLEKKVTDLSICIDIPTSVEIFSKRLSRNMKRNLRKRMRKLKEEYQVEIKTNNSFSSVEEGMNIFFDLHQKRWQSEGQAGVFSEKIFRDFHLDVARYFSERKWLHLYFLTVNEYPIASIYSFDYKQKKYGYLTGFDPMYRKFSPGNLLKMYVIEKCVQEGLKEYDLMRGFEAYKAEWGTKIRKNFEFQLVNKGLFIRIHEFAKRNLLFAKTKYYYLAKSHSHAITLAQKLGLT